MEKYISYIFYLIMTFFIIIGINLGFKIKNNGLTKRSRIEFFKSLPSIFTTIGILGTFSGIFIGLLNFDVTDISNSIPDLLEGLKTAFSTSILGIILSLVFKIYGQNIVNESKISSNYRNELSALNEVVNILNEIKSNSLKEQDENIHLRKFIKSVFDPEVESSIQSIIAIYHTEFSRSFNDLNNTLEEFSDILIKNNTEALVEVFKKATESFNTQMNEVIERLVKENFNELNNSVKNLNDWQTNNLEMIEKLTDHFKSVSKNIELTSESIKSISDSTDELVGTDSMLIALITELQNVLIKNSSFEKVSNNLLSSSELVKNNIEAFDETTNKLNQWIGNNKDLMDSVDILISKLEDVGKIKDINGEFWDNTKTQLGEGVAIISNASTELRDNLDSISEEFTQQLSDTLTNLDELIQRLMEKSFNKAYVNEQ